MVPLRAVVILLAVRRQVRQQALARAARVR
jgi:hypothetical protein